MGEAETKAWSSIRPLSRREKDIEVFMAVLEPASITMRFVLGIKRGARRYLKRIS